MGHQSLGCVLEVMAVIHPNPRVVGDESDIEAPFVGHVQGVNPPRAAGGGYPVAGQHDGMVACRCMG